jgi:hypothetical protein
MDSTFPLSSVMPDMDQEMSEPPYRPSRCIPPEPARSTVRTWATTKIEVKGENKMKVVRKKDKEEDKENTRKM